MGLVLRESLFGRTLNWLTNDRSSPHMQPSTTALNGAALDFTGPDDPGIPRNWPALVKAIVLADIMLLNFSFYKASAIFTPSIPLIEAEFGASVSEGTLGLSLFVIAYGIGPLFVSPIVIKIPYCQRGSEVTMTNTFCSVAPALPYLKPPNRWAFASLCYRIACFLHCQRWHSPGAEHWCHLGASFHWRLRRKRAHQCRRRNFDGSLRAF